MLCQTDVSWDGTGRQPQKVRKWHVRSMASSVVLKTQSLRSRLSCDAFQFLESLMIAVQAWALRVFMCLFDSATQQNSSTIRVLFLLWWLMIEYYDICLFVCRMGHTCICCCPKRKRQTGRDLVAASHPSFIHTLWPLLKCLLPIIIMLLSWKQFLR